MILLTFSGCVLTEPLDVVDDTQVNFRPSIVSTDPPSNLKVTIDPTATSGREFRVTLEDENLTDSLYGRFFVDYSATSTAPAGPIAFLTVPPAAMPTPMDATRLPQGTQIVCDPNRIPVDGMIHILTLFVADRPYRDDNMPPYFRHLPADAKETQVSWTVICQ